MNYLLDTHILLWARFEPWRISEAYQDIITAPANQKYVSTISIWEISLKYALGKLNLKGDTPEQFLAGTQALGYQITMPTAEAMAGFYRLPLTTDHKDPFDRLLVWQAIQQDFALLTHDTKMTQYEAHGLKLA